MDQLFFLLSIHFSKAFIFNGGMRRRHLLQLPRLMPDFLLLLFIMVFDDLAHQISAYITGLPLSDAGFDVGVSHPLRRPSSVSHLRLQLRQIHKGNRSIWIVGQGVIHPQISVLSVPLFLFLLSPSLFEEGRSFACDLYARRMRSGLRPLLALAGLLLYTISQELSLIVLPCSRHVMTGKLCIVHLIVCHYLNF